MVRRRRRRRRKKPVAPVLPRPQSYSAKEAAFIAGTTPATFKRWLRRGWLPPVRFLGRYTRYSALHVYLAKALPWMGQLPKHPRFLQIAAVILGEPPPTDILGAPTPPAPEAPPALPPPIEAPPANEIIPLGPGLNLELTPDAPPLMRALAEAIVRQVKG